MLSGLIVNVIGEQANQTGPWLDRVAVEPDHDKSFYRLRRTQPTTALRVKFALLRWSCSSTCGWGLHPSLVPTCISTVVNTRLLVH
jgi:hypothetical protein